MTKWLVSSLAAFALSLPTAAVTVSPILQPHVTFVDASGLPCAGCKLYSYIAGSTTAQPTYTDSTGIPTNTNPIVLDPAGGANIWTGSTPYKFALYDALGTLIWSVDNVSSVSSLVGVYPPAYSIQVANAGVNGLLSDPYIKVDTAAHTINVGVLPINHLSIGAMGTPTSWVLDTTTPATALASLGQMPYAQINGPNGSTACLVWNGASPSLITTGTCPSSLTTTGTTGAATLTGAVLNIPVYQGALTLTTSGSGAATLVANTLNIPTPTAVTRTCNSNGCYRVEGDGTIESWGRSSVATGGDTAESLTITFPTTYTSTTNLEVTVGTFTSATGDGFPHPADCHITRSTLSTTGATAIIAIPVQVSGSGYAALAAGDYCSWHALGN